MCHAKDFLNSERLALLISLVLVMTHPVDNLGNCCAGFDAVSASSHTYLCVPHVKLYYYSNYFTSKDTRSVALLRAMYLLMMPPKPVGYDTMDENVSGCRPDSIFMSSSILT